MDISTILLWFSFVLACLHILSLATSARNLPPGPFPLPIVGSLFKLGKVPHDSLAQLAKTYGPLMTLKLGSVTTIVVSSASMAKEVLQKHDQPLSGRTVVDAVRVLTYHEASIVWSQPSPQWRNLRKICATQMFTTQRLNADEGIRVMKVNELVDYVRDNAKSRQAISIGQAVFTTILNVLSNVVFSIDLANFSSESAQDLKAIVWGVMEEAGKANFADYFPLLRPFDPQGIRRRTANYFGKLDDIFDALIDQRIKPKEQDASNDLLAAFLNSTDENGSKLCHPDIKSVLKDLFIAGVDTSTSTVEWAMAEVLRDQEIMAKVKLELKENIDKDKLIDDSEITRLPYLQAIVKETLRLHPPAPLLVPRRAETNVEVSGFSVPRHAQVLVNAWAISRHPDIWPNATSFMPDRFLGSSVDFRGQDFELIPFGAGRRICPGLPLASRMVHLILASLVRSFDWELEDGMKLEDISMEEKVGFTLQKAKPLRAIPIQTCVLDQTAGKPTSLNI